MFYTSNIPLRCLWLTPLPPCVGRGGLGLRPFPRERGLASCCRTSGQSLDTTARSCTLSTEGTAGECSTCWRCIVAPCAEPRPGCRPARVIPRPLPGLTLGDASLHAHALLAILSLAGCAPVRCVPVSRPARPCGIDSSPADTSGASKPGGVPRRGAGHGRAALHTVPDCICPDACSCWPANCPQSALQVKSRPCWMTTGLTNY